MAKITDAQKRASMKYRKNKYAQINVVMLPDKKEAIKSHAEKTGETVNGFIIRAVFNQIAIDNKLSENDPD